MAIIGRIRKHSMLLVGFIALGLILFLVMDGLQSNSNALLGKNSDTIGKVNGVTLSQPEFNDKMEENISIFLLNKEPNYQITEEEKDQIREQTWNQFMDDAVFKKTMKDNGLDVSPKEMVELTTGTFVDPQLKQSFTNPQTRQFDPNLVRNFIQTLDQENDPNDAPGTKRKRWTAFEKYIKDNRYNTKFNNLVSKSMDIPGWMQKNAAVDFNTTADFNVVGLPYFEIADSSIKVSDAELEAYLKKNPKKFEQDAFRQVKLVSFPVLPSTYDSANVYKWMDEHWEALRNAESDSIYINAWSEKRWQNYYFTKDELQGPFADSIFRTPVGSYFGPYQEDGKLIVAKVEERKVLSDSVRVRHILLSGENLTSQEQVNDLYKLYDSLFRQLDTLGADFTTLANAFSQDPGNTDPASNLKKGGDLGWVKPGQMVPQFDAAIFQYDNGRIMKVATEYGLHLVQVTQRVPTKPAVKVAYLVKSFIPSQETENAILNKVSLFSAENQEKTKFDSSITATPSLMARSVYLSKNQFDIPGVGQARQVVRWAFENPTNSVSQPFRVGEQYLVGLIETAGEKGIAKVADRRLELEAEVRKEKKGEMLEKKMKDAAAKNVNELAQKLGKEAVPVSAINFNAQMIPGVGSEPKVLGAAFGMQPNQMMYVIGNNGVYAVELTKINKADESALTDVSMYKKLLEGKYAAKIANGSVINALIKGAEPIDNRFRFY